MINITFSDSAYLGVINNSTATHSFDCNGADFLIVSITWSYVDEFSTIPLNVKYGSKKLSILDSPRVTHETYGKVLHYYLENPDSGTNDLTLSSPPAYYGNTQITILGLTGTKKRIGVRDHLIMENSTDSISISNVNTNSYVIANAFSIFSKPTNLIANIEWNELSNSEGEYGTAHLWYAEGLDGEILTLTSESYTSMVVSIFEIYELAEIEGSSIEFISSEIFYSGPLDVGDEVDFSYTSNQPEYLLIAMARGNITERVSVLYNNKQLRFIPIKTQDDDIGMIELAIIPNPVNDINFKIIGRAGYFGPTMLMAIGLNNTSGVTGIQLNVSNPGTVVENIYSNSNSQSKIISFIAQPFAKSNVISFNELKIDAQSIEEFMNGWILTKDGGNDKKLELYNDSFANSLIFGIEFKEMLTELPDFQGSLIKNLPEMILDTMCEFDEIPDSSGKTFHLYWESFFDNPNRINPVADDYYLAKVPSYVDVVYLSFGKVQCSYVDLSSDIKDTVGLNFEGTCNDFKKLIDLVKSRCPNIKFMLSLQQSTPEEYIPEPYDSDGWGGMTSTHVANIKKFLDDVGIDGVSIDYELLSSIDDLEHHCQTDPETGLRYCYTDQEFTDVLTLLRNGLPQGEYLIDIAALHVGFFGEDEYINASPVGWNSGYNLFLKNNEELMNKLDGIHIMNYDAGFEYDPVMALRACRKYFPTIPSWIGLRAGPPEWGDGGPETGPKRSLNELIHYMNAACMLGADGVFMYAMLWDIALPSGSYSPDYPDSNIIAQEVAKRFNKPNVGQRLTRKSSSSMIIL